MGIQAIGDRVYMVEMIKMLKKKKLELETTAAKWSGETPAGGCGMCIFFIRPKFGIQVSGLKLSILYEKYV